LKSPRERKTEAISWIISLFLLFMAIFILAKATGK
jgi:hypothetical protein